LLDAFLAGTTLRMMRSGRDQVVQRDGFFRHQFVAEHAGFFAPTRSQSAAAGSATARRQARALYVLPAIAINLSGTARYLRFALCRQPTNRCGLHGAAPAHLP
jgi:hypothetical protein